MTYLELTEKKGIFPMTWERFPDKEAVFQRGLIVLPNKGNIAKREGSGSGTL
jgi:hypothetical protein